MHVHTLVDNIYIQQSLFVALNQRPNEGAIPLLQRTFKLADDQIMVQPTIDGPRYRIIVGPDFNPCYYDNGDIVPIENPTPTPP